MRQEHIINSVKVRDGESINQEEAYELRAMVEDLLDEVRNSIEDLDRVEALIAVSRDLRNTANQAAESFWKTAKFYLDDEFASYLSDNEEAA